MLVFWYLLIHARILVSALCIESGIFQNLESAHKQNGRRRVFKHFVLRGRSCPGDGDYGGSVANEQSGSFQKNLSTSPTPHETSSNEPQRQEVAEEHERNSQV